MHRVSRVKCDISDKAYENFEFPAVGENICSSRTAVKQALRERNMRRR
jgi:hypothetical protein